MEYIVVITACIIMLGYLGLTAGALYLMNRQQKLTVEVLARLFENK